MVRNRELTTTTNEGVMKHRLAQASRAELDRLCGHLGLSLESDATQIERGYIRAADHFISEAVRTVVQSDTPSYSKALRLIYNELRPYSEALDETWTRVKALKIRQYQSRSDALSDQDLELQILNFYAAEYRDLKDEVERQSSVIGKVLRPFRKTAGRLIKRMPGLGRAVFSATSAYTAIRLPFAAAAPSVAAGPFGIALAVVLLGYQLAGPAYRKIIPATVELMLIGQRIANMPEE